MARSRFVSGGAILTAAFGLTLCASAAAQGTTPNAADISAARSLGIEGVQLADAGNCTAAIDKLERAEALYHAPTILERLGVCQIAVGRIVAGTENLQRVVREPLPPRSPAAFVLAQERAKKALDASLPKIAKLKIHLEAPPWAKAVVKVDGESVSLATLDVDRPADPGKHSIEASAAGCRTALAEVTLQQGGSGGANLRLDADPSATAPAPVPVAPAAAPPAAAPMQPQYAEPQYAPSPYAAQPQPQPAAVPPAGAPDAAQGRGSSAMQTVGYVLIGVGVVGTMVGTVFGVMAIGKKAALETACGSNKNACPADSQGNIDSMKSYANNATIGFVVGGVGIVGGIALAVAGGVSKSSAPAPAPATGLVVRPWIGLNSIGASGAF